MNFNVPSEATKHLALEGHSKFAINQYLHVF